MTTTFTAKSPEDLLAAVPVVLGFAPEDSLVMLTFGGYQQFHARLNLPTDDEAIPDCVAAVLRPATTYRVEAVVFVLYTPDDRLARRLSGVLVAAFEDCKIEVVACLRAHEGRWFAPIGRVGVPDEGIPYDISSHQFRVASVYDGKVTLGSRAELAAQVAPDPELVAETDAALEEAVPLSASGVAGLIARSLPRGRVGDAEDLASLLLALRDPDSRDQLWSGLRRHEAESWVPLWADVVRRSPERLVAHPASLLAFVAWLRGEGALAWCAVDRCLAADPDNQLGGLVVDILTEAIPPSAWEASLE